MKIIVDADACPVKEEIQEIALGKGISVLLVAALSHEMPQVEGIQVRVVDNLPQAADIAIINSTEPGDIIITADGGLASLALSRKAHVLSFRGYQYSEKNIEGVLNQRYLGQKIRKAGGRLRGPRPFQKEDRERFCDSLNHLITISSGLE
jgi:uncharacterized protein YaiI (UPF0178 family)